VDISNLNRQILHAYQDIGRPKTDSALEKLRALNPHCEITAFYEEIGNGNVRELVGDADIIVDSTDNLRTRKALNHASVNLHIPFVYGGINGFNGMVSTFIPGQTPCLECLFGSFKEPDTPPDVIGPIAALVGAIQSLEVIKWILKMDGLLANQMLIIDGVGMGFKKIAIDRDAECVICSSLRD
jgi:adenylyltransferase/sulfurtransferase